MWKFGFINKEWNHFQYFCWEYLWNESEFCLEKSLNDESIDKKDCLSVINTALKEQFFTWKKKFNSFLKFIFKNFDCEMFYLRAKFNKQVSPFEFISITNLKMRYFITFYWISWISFIGRKIRYKRNGWIFDIDMKLHEITRWLLPPLDNLIVSDQILLSILINLNKRYSTCYHNVKEHKTVFFILYTFFFILADRTKCGHTRG